MSNEREAMNDRIREIFLANGFTIKEGQTDLKPYVYEAAYALLRATQFHAGATGQEPVGTLSIHRFRKIDSMVNHDFEYYGSLPDGTYRVYAAPIGDNGAKDENVANRSVVRAALIGLARHVRAVPAYSKLLGDMEEVDKAIDLLAAPHPSQPAESKREDFEADAKRLALELECLLLSCKDQAAVSKWWDSAMEALEQHRALLARASAKGE
jgi:hypothetical protein